MAHIVVDPVTRIEGHLRVEIEVEGNKVTDAISSGTAWRGLEVIAKNRDPRDLWAYIHVFVAYVLVLILWAVFVQ